MTVGRDSWHYRGRLVAVSRSADIPAEYRRGCPGAEIVQQVLDNLDRWHGQGHKIVTAKFDGPNAPKLVVARGELRPIWAKHLGHHAQDVQLSPFVKLRTDFMTNQFTLELTGPVSAPRLVRAYPGGYVPPLPWQQSARSIDGGVRKSQVYWRRHAFVYRKGRAVMLEEGEAPLLAPSWFRAR